MNLQCACLTAWLAIVCLSMPGCNSAQSRAAEAYAQYQLASANNNPIAAREALQRLVAADEANLDAWVTLGRLELSLGEYRAAYNSFFRARELDRANAELLRILTQIALMSGDVALAGEHAADLAVISPDDVWVKLTEGYVALARRQYAESLSLADGLLDRDAYLPPAVVLKARSLLGQGRANEAKELLAKQLVSQPTDINSAVLLAKLYKLDEDWAGVATAARQIVDVQPTVEARLLLAEAGFRSGDYKVGRAASLAILTRQPLLHDAKAVLDLWRHRWPSSQRITDAQRLGFAAARKDLRLVYANFLNQVGSAREAIDLAGKEDLPVTAGNVQANAVIGGALASLGKPNAGKEILDAVLRYDPGNEIALRARAELLARAGYSRLAIADAQKLVSTSPQSAEARLLLAQVLRTAGRSGEADAVLWEGFKTIRGNDALYRALLVSLKRKGGDPMAVNREYAAQRASELEGEWL